jgi:Legume lectin domain/Glucose / Sorbosone dehydrogenase
MKFNFKNFSNALGLTLNGSASTVDGLRLTTASPFEAGSAFYNTSFYPNTNWETHFQFKTDRGAGGGDGFAFILQNKTASPNLLGLHGGSLGYGSPTSGGKSFAIEFDTAKNSWDNNNNHVAFLKNGNVTEHLAIATPSLDLNSGKLVNVWLNYDGQTKEVNLYLSSNNVKPADSLLSAEVDLPALVGSEAILGFSGGTGGKYNEHSIKKWSFESQDAPNSNHPPEAPPIINPPPGALLDPTSFKFQLPEDFALIDPDGDLHDHTDYEIWLKGENSPAWVAHDVKDDFSKIHAIFPTIGTFVNSHQGKDSLLPNQDYILKVRVADPWSAESPWTEQIHRTASIQPPSNGDIPWQVLEPGYAIELVAGGLRLPAQLDFNTKNGLIIGSELHDGPFTIDSSGKAHRLAKLVDYDPGDDIGGESERGAIGLAYDEESHSIFQGVLDANSFPVIYRLFLSDDGLSVISTQKIWDYADAGKQAHQITNLAIHGGHLYVSMGDKFSYKTAKDLNSPWGKILRLNLDGSAVVDNPFYELSDGINAKDYIHSYGFRNPVGADWFDGRYYIVENGPDANDRLVIDAPGKDFGWNGTPDSLEKDALYLWNPTEAPVDITFEAYLWLWASKRQDHR